MVSIVSMTMNVDTLVCVIQMLTVLILMVHMNAHVRKGSQVTANNAVISMNVLQDHVTKMHYVPMFRVVSCASVTKVLLVMVLHVLILTSVPIHRVLPLVNAPISVVILPVVVTKVTVVMDTRVQR